MKISTRLLVGFFLIILMSSIIGVISYVSLQKISEPLEKQIPSEIDNLLQILELNKLADLIQYYDEVLTMSARNYAFTGDTRWVQRYNDTVPKLDSAIMEILERGDSVDKGIFTSIDTANNILIEEESLALQQADKDNLKAAVAILESEKYWKQKDIYKRGLDAYFSKRGSQSIMIVEHSMDTVNSTIEYTKSITQKSIFILLLTLGSMIFCSIIISVVISKSIINPIKKLQKGIKVVEQGNLDYSIKQKGRDEISQLSQAFDTMTQTIKKTIEDSDDQVKNKIENERKLTKKSNQMLEHLNKVMVGRELNIIKLKKEIEDMKKAASGDDTTSSLINTDNQSA